VAVVAVAENVTSARVAISTSVSTIVQRTRTIAAYSTLRVPEAAAHVAAGASSITTNSTEVREIVTSDISVSTFSTTG
jgi:hypothetical protein